MVLDLLSNTAFLGTNDSRLPSEAIRADDRDIMLSAPLPLHPPLSPTESWPHAYRWLLC